MGLANKQGKNIALIENGMYGKAMIL